MTEPAHIDLPSSQRSLKVKAISFVALIILAVGGFLSWRFLSQSEEILTTELQTRALAFSNNLARSSKYGILTEDPEILREVADGALQEEGVVYVRINNAQGTVLVEQFKAPIVTDSPVGSSFRRITTVDPAWNKPFITYRLVDGVGIYHTFAQVQTHRSGTASRLSSELMLLGESNSAPELNEQKIIQHGNVQILLSSEKVIDKIRRTLFAGILLALVIVGIAQALLFFGVDYMIRPLRAMAQAALNISRGDLSQRVPVRSRDEIGVLATAFNHMTESLSTMTQSQQRRLAELSTLHDIGIDMSSTRDEERLVDLTLHAVVGRLSYDRAMFFRYSDEKRALVDGRVAGAPRVLDATLRDLEIPLEEGGLCGTVALTGEAVLVPDASKAMLPIDASMAHLRDARSFLAAPVKFEDRTLGMLVVESLGRTLTDPDLSLVATLCSQLAVAMANASGYRQIEQLNVSLEQKVAARTAELQTQQDRLKEVNDRLRHATRHKSEFLARMSHELRTPLNAIIGYSEMLMEELEGTAEKTLIEDLKKIHFSGNHLLSLINDILDLSKVEAGKMERYIESVDVASLVSGVRATVSPLMEKNGNTFSVACPDNMAPLQTDITKLRQILLNLLSNAAKFTDKGAVSLTVSDVNKAGKRWLSFVVKDSGIGISALQMKNLFQEFSQADVSTSRRYGGTGLGLAICKRYCEMMGGHIDAESTLGQGTRLTVWLPAEISDASPRPQDDALTLPSMEGDRPGSNRTVLVIDDDASTREIITRFLSKGGFRTVAASNGESGLKLAKQLRPSAITLDVMMPGVDGWTVLAQLKADPDLADIPVIVVTILDEKDMGFSLGAADYMSKPIDRERLLAIVRRHCRESPHGRVLVVEDDDNSRTMISRMVAKDGWTVVEAENGRVALDMLAEQGPPEIILLDLIMPVMDGLQFIDELRKRPQWRSIPIVVLTAKDLTQAERFLLNEHVQTILEKSALSRDALLREMTSSIGRVREALQKA